MNLNVGINIQKRNNKISNKWYKRTSIKKESQISSLSYRVKNRGRISYARRLRI
jgi:hypothetical protein